MRRYYCDRCDLEIEDPDTNLVRIEIQGQRHDCCSRSPCINAFNDLQKELDDYARQGMENYPIFRASRLERFWEEANTYGESQEAANGQ